ncbi:MAG: esterase-like activity of phytase family protein [Sedimentisphaerales bacterium]|nr:esterase-like activity of phytase family protein [Sedimentisphaerales bacterium]
MKRSNLKSLLPAVLFFSLLACPVFSQITITAIGNYDLVAPGGLSGITWVSGNQFYLINDNGHKMYPATINIDSNTGAITSASLGTEIVLDAGSDLEGIAYDPDGNSDAGSVFISDEVGPALREHALDGTLINTLPVPTVYTTGRSNKLLESLTRQQNGATIWTANEEALTNDGPISTFTAGTVVRLQRFTRSETGYIPNGQWAYETEKIAHDSPLVPNEVSGLSDLCVLPNGQLLALERQLTGSGIGLNFPEFRNHIYLIDFNDATDITAIPALDGATYTKTSKTLLWSGTFGLPFSNYEGLALGPQLTDGSHSLLMISDGDDQPDEDLYALKISGNIKMPLPSCHDADIVLDDSFINLLDYTVLAAQFTLTEPNLNADIDHDGDCDIIDLYWLTSFWLLDCNNP